MWQLVDGLEVLLSCLGFWEFFRGFYDTCYFIGKLNLSGFGFAYF